MEQRSARPSSKWPKVPPWTILVAVLGALILAGIMFNRDYRREQGHLKEMFLQRGEVLIHSLEMVGRVRFGEAWETAHLQTFWNNLEADDNVLFLALTDESGRPLALVGDLSPDPGVFHDPVPNAPGEGPISPNYRLGNIGGRKVFMVYRPFWPMPRPLLKNKQHHQSRSFQERPGRGHSQRRSGQGPPAMDPPPVGPPAMGPALRREPPIRYLWVAFDLTPSEKDTHSRVRTAAVFIGLFCLAGLAGVLALIWGHNSRLARRLYQDTNALAAELIGRLPIGVILKNEQGRVSLVNQATMSISGLKEADFLGRSLGELTFGRFPAEETLAGREINLGFKGGHNVRVALTCGPVISDDGHSLGQVILMEDLGEVGRLKAELAKKERLATLGGLAAGLAHEIRNPLGAIRGLTQHLLSKGPSDVNDQEALEVMLASVDRLNSTITDFLDYARPTEIKTAPLDLVELLRNLTILAGHDARSQAVEISLDLPEQPVIIEGDEALLSQAFLNIYINAIESAGGRPEGGGRLAVTLALEEKRAVLSFHDNGPGFKPDQLAQPFVPYFTTKAEGTGLGLALVEKTIRAHEGADIALGAPPSGGGLVTISFRLMPESGKPESDNHELPETADIDS